MNKIKFKIPQPVKVESATVFAQSAGQTIGWPAKRYGIDYLHKLGMTGEGVRIGVIDTGVDYRTKDLNVKKSDVFDHTGEGLHRFKKSYNGHGIGTASIIAAVDNDYGVRGWAYNATVYGLKALMETGEGNLDWIILAVYKAIELDLDILNLSIGSDVGDHRLEIALLEFLKSGPNKHIVCASGNGGRNKKASFPARYPFTHSIGSLGRSGDISDFTSDKGGTVDFYMSGEDMLAAWSNDGFVRTSGTSFSAPLFTGLLACLISGGYVFNQEDLKLAVIDPTNVDIKVLHDYVKVVQPVDNRKMLIEKALTEVNERYLALGTSINAFKVLLEQDKA